MHRIQMTLAAAVAAAAFTAAPAQAAVGEQPPCDPGPCLDYVIERKVEQTLDTLRELTVEGVVATVKCAGDALAGNPCHE